MSLCRTSLLTSLILLLTYSSAVAEKVRVSVPEMDCEHCSHAIEDRLKREKDISKVEIDLKSKEISIYTVDPTKISDEELRALIKDSGFEATTIVRGE